MSNEKNFSDEFLNAFVDDQLTHEEKADAYVHINQDQALSQRVCELRKVHDLVQFAYKNPPAAPQHTATAGAGKPLYRNIAAGLVAALTLTFGAALGWQIAGGNHSATVADANKTLASQEQQQMKVLFHLNSGEPAQIKEALDEVESLLKYYKKNNQMGRIEIVTNGEGINLLRIDTSQFTERVLRMQKEYDNLTFVACQNSLDILANDANNNAKLIPGTVVIESGVAQIMRRQQQGWAYIQV